MIYEGQGNWGNTQMVWTKPAPSKDWPMHESLYEGTGSSKKVGRVVIRKGAYSNAERGKELFLARGLIRLHDAGPGLLRLGSSEVLIAPWTIERGAPQIYVKVEYSAEGYWRWVCDRATDVEHTRRYPEAWWLI